MTIYLISFWPDTNYHLQNLITIAVTASDETDAWGRVLDLAVDKAYPQATAINRCLSVFIDDTYLHQPNNDKFVFHHDCHNLTDELIVANRELFIFSLQLAIDLGSRTINIRPLIVSTSGTIHS
jgi:hypothetical protein